jgi:hypothetical protein
VNVENIFAAGSETGASLRLGRETALGIGDMIIASELGKRLRKRDTPWNSRSVDIAPQKPARKINGNYVFYSLVHKISSFSS